MTTLSSESAIVANVPPAIAHTPAASPSRPSRKLTMFMIATIQKTVAGTPTQLGSDWIPTTREREAVDPDAERDDGHRGADLAAELLPPDEAARVVERADHRRDRGAEQDPAHGRRQVDERDDRDEDPEEERRARRGAESG